MWDAFKAVFWSFLGVRKHSEYEADAKRIKVQHVIAAGLMSAAVFVLVLIGIVQWVTK
jgi:hypothetical protein